MAEIDVTVITATRNRPALLRTALDSIARQTLTNYEVWVIDDGSDAEHAAANAAMFTALDARFHLLQPLQPGETGRGPATSRNRGIELAKGRYVAFLDDDDSWMWDQYLELAVEVLDKTGCDLFAAEMESFKGGLKVMDSWFSDSEPGRRLKDGVLLRENPSVYKVPRRAFVMAVAKRTPHPDTLVVRRDAAIRGGGFLRRLNFGEDQVFAMMVADGTDQVLFCDRPAAHYRLPEGNSVSLINTEAERQLQRLAVGQFLKMNAASADSRRAARQIESWSLRELSTILQSRRRHGTAVGMILEALSVYPTFGCALQLLTATGKAIFTRSRGGEVRH